MTGTELITNITREMPDAPLGDFIALVNRSLRELERQHLWNEHRVDIQYSATETLACALVNGSATLTAATAYFTDALVGQSVVVTSGGDDYTLEVAAVPTPTTLTLTAAWDETSDPSASVVTPFRTDWRFPANLFRVLAVLSEDNRVQYRDPIDYRVGPVESGRRHMIWIKNRPVGPINLWYYRHPTAMTAMGDEIDVPVAAEDCLLYLLLWRLSVRATQSGAMDEVSIQTAAMRMRDYQTEYLRALSLAKSANNQERGMLRRNQPVLLRIER